MPAGDTVHPRPMDPKKDLAVYGFGSVTWTQRMEDWKKKQNEKLQVVEHDGEKNADEITYHRYRQLDDASRYQLAGWCANST